MADEVKPQQQEAQNKSRPVWATVNVLEVFEYEDLRITYKGTEVPVGKVKGLTEAAKRQNVELQELN